MNVGNAATSDTAETNELGWVTLTGIRARGSHGLLDAERRLGQEFVVDVALNLPIDTTSDDITNTVNYADVAVAVVACIESRPVNLIETLAGRIADVCLEEPLVQRVRVVVHKPQAPIPVTFGDVFVTIERSRRA